MSLNWRVVRILLDAEDSPLMDAHDGFQTNMKTYKYILQSSLKTYISTFRQPPNIPVRLDAPHRFSGRGNARPS